jgi:MFS family permease
MGTTNSSSVFVTGVVLFFIAFNMMEPLVQSMTTKFAKVHQRGAALGVANAAAYLMTFVGGVVAGFLFDVSGREIVGISMASVSVVWFLWTLRLQNPPKYSHLYLYECDVDKTKLMSLEGEHIAEWYTNDTEKLVVIKYLQSAMSEDELKAKVLKSSEQKEDELKEKVAKL